ncbi:MAG: endo-1,4-beta-xylanase [Kiritimatiellia bacterium]
MNNKQNNLLESANRRIEQYRKGKIYLTITDKNGEKVAGARVRAKQKSHQFLFGCNIYPLEPENQSEEQRSYKTRFEKLFNFATLPFYWGTYEREPGEKQEERLKAMAAWCSDHCITPKGHPLVWHSVWPSWGPDDPDEAREMLQKRVRNVANGFRTYIKHWDVINESTVSADFDNGLGKWVAREGPADVASQCLEWAHDAAPEAVLLVNDFNVSPEYQKQLAELTDRGAPIDAIGIQSHMHGGEWELKRLWEVCEEYARFELPIHFTETTVLSGKRIPDDVPFDEANWQDWPSTPEGEKRQCEYVESFYTLLFSHPSVEAITWWDLRDGCWKNAPAGLLRLDLSPKPAYERLHTLIHSEWTTDKTLITDSSGAAVLNGFYGKYDLQLVGTSTETSFDHRSAEGTSDIRVVLPG